MPPVSYRPGGGGEEVGGVGGGMEGFAFHPLPFRNFGAHFDLFTQHFPSEGSGFVDFFFAPLNQEFFFIRMTTDSFGFSVFPPFYSDDFSLNKYQ